MALSGSVKTSTYGSMGLILSWTATQNVSANTSTIKWTLKSFGRESNFWYMAGNFKVVIDGSTAYSSADRIKLYGNGATTVATGSKTITHNNDGSRSFSVNVEAGIYTVAVNCTGSGSFTLDKIARTPSAPTSVVIDGKPNGGYESFIANGEQFTLSFAGATGVITGYEYQIQYGGGSWSGSTSTKSGGVKITVSDKKAGTTVKARVRAMNGSLASAWKESNVLTVSGAMDLKVSGAWKTGSVWIKVNGSWKRAKRVWIKVNGTWKISK